MKIYEVMVVVEPSLAEPFENYMRKQHIPEILGTGCFTEISFEAASPTRFRTRYIARTEADIQGYIETHAPHFRSDFMAHFPEGCEVHRETWTSLQHFKAGPA